MSASLSRIPVVLRAPYNTAAPRGPLSERFKLVRTIQREIANDHDVVILKRRIRRAPAGVVYMLPYHVLLTPHGFRLGEPMPSWEASYPEYRRLDAFHLREVYSAQQAADEIRNSIKTYSKDPRSLWGSAGNPRHGKLGTAVGLAFWGSAAKLAAPIAYGRLMHPPTSKL